MNIFHGIQNVYQHIHLWYIFLTIVFASIVTYMLLYGKRSKDHQQKLEGRGTHFDSKEMGILEAQDAMKHERREHHRR